MKKMRMRVRKWFKLIGTALIVLSCATPVHAQEDTMLHLTPLGEGFEMHTTAEEQRVALRAILKTAMSILLDDAPYDPKNIIFGTNYTT